MDERKPARPKHDDVPIIGDYSGATDAKLHADAQSRADAPSRPEARLREDPRFATESSPPPAPRAPAPPRAHSESWALDPSDVHRHAQRARRQREGAGPLRKIVRYGFIALALVAAVAAYLNWDTLRGVTIDVSALTSLFAKSSGTPGGAQPGPGGEPATVNVAAPVVVGDQVPVTTAPPAAEREAAATPATPATPAALPVAEPAAAPAVAAAEQAPADEPVERRAAAAAAPPVAAPEVPDGPETFEFGIPVVNVNEADASAAVIILRNGGRRRASSVTWWTKDGTAKAGEDYADLGKVVVRFAAGEQNHTIHIPIVSDSKVEGPETFYVYLATSESAIAAGEPTEMVEVVINDRQ